MRWLFGRKKKTTDNGSTWKACFDDCSAEDYLPDFSVCRNVNNANCRYLTRYEGMILCSHPRHRTFIPDGAAPFNP